MRYLGVNVDEPTDFDVFMMCVDAHLVQMCGLQSGDLPDYLYRDAYDDGVDSHSVAVDVLEQAVKCFGLEV